jgi:hypothetical protein
MSNRLLQTAPARWLVLDHDRAEDPGYDIDEEIQFHDSEVDPWLRCEEGFKMRYGKERST